MAMALKKRFRVQRGPEDEYLGARGLPASTRNRALVHDFIARHRARRPGDDDLFAYLDANLRDALSVDTAPRCEVLRLPQGLVPATTFG